LNIQETASEMLREIFVQTPTLLTRALYQLCILSEQTLIYQSSETLANTHRSKKASISTASAVCVLIDSTFNKTERLRLVNVLIDIARSEEVLECKVRLRCLLYLLLLYQQTNPFHTAILISAEGSRPLTDR
jgi:hypothetical protein